MLKKLEREKAMGQAGGEQRREGGRHKEGTSREKRETSQNGINTTKNSGINNPPPWPDTSSIPPFLPQWSNWKL